MKPQHLWALSRLAARDLLYGTADRAIPPDEAYRWIEQLMAYNGANPNPVGRAISQIARQTGDRVRDIGDEMRIRVLDWMDGRGFADDMQRPVREIIPLAAQDKDAMFGESLPQGIILRD